MPLKLAIGFHENQSDSGSSIMDNTSSDLLKANHLAHAERMARDLQSRGYDPETIKSMLLNMRVNEADITNILLQLSTSKLAQASWTPVHPPLSLSFGMVVATFKGCILLSFFVFLGFEASMPDSRLDLGPKGFGEVAGDGVWFGILSAILVCLGIAAQGRLKDMFFGMLFLFLALRIGIPAFKRSGVLACGLWGLIWMPALYVAFTCFLPMMRSDRNRGHAKSEPNLPSNTD